MAKFWASVKDSATAAVILPANVLIAGERSTRMLVTEAEIFASAQAKRQVKVLVDQYHTLSNEKVEKALKAAITDKGIRDQVLANLQAKRDKVAKKLSDKAAAAQPSTTKAEAKAKAEKAEKSASETTETT